MQENRHEVVALALAARRLAAAAWLEKAGPKLPVGTDPLTPEGFVAWEAGFDKELAELTHAERLAIARGAASAEAVSWRSLGPAGQRAAIAAVARRMVVVGVARAGDAGAALAGAAGKMLAASSRATAARDNLVLGPRFNAVDPRITAHVRSSSTNFVRNEMGKREVALSNLARSVVTNGVRQGFSSRDIGRDLSKQMLDNGLARSDAYWNMVSSVYAARARSYGQIETYKAAGITAYKLIAVLDEHTTETCIYLDGKIVQVGAASALMDRVMASEPEDVSWMLPFVQRSRDDAGEYLYYKNKDGVRVEVARVDVPGRGAADSRGVYRDSISSTELLDHGIGMPPFHGHCRTTTSSII